MHGEEDEIIYVGKAVVLKNRVRQYFQDSRSKTAKIRKMVSNIRWFEYIVTDSETEALMLECNLIKEHRPKYNTMLVDDKSYPFIRVTVKEAFPRVILTRDMKRDRSRYFGPYDSSQSVRDTIELLRKLFQIRTCSRRLPEDIGKERPCLNASLGLCSAPCAGKITEEAYRERIDSVIRFLEGNDREIADNLKKEMKKASDEMDFEAAIRYRDLLQSISRVTSSQKITDLNHDTDRDFIAAALDGTDAVVSVFFVRNGQLIGRDHYHMRSEEDETKPRMIENFVKQYYTGTPFIPKEIYLETEISDREAIEAMLSRARGHKVSIFVPKKGQKEHFLTLAGKNASMILEREKDRISKEEAHTIGAVRELAGLLGLPDVSRIEAYDISNTSGFESVGSMVVFTDGKARKNDYRRFRLKTVTGPDDYASMHEVLTRRFREAIDGNEAFSALPDLVLMDGGKGQVNVARVVLREYGLKIPVAGMVKDDRHRTRGIYYHDKEVPVDTHSEAFRLVTRIQDEAHRFAITFHRGLHVKHSIASVLREIPGIGPKRELALMRRFENLEEIRSASVEELAKTEGFHMQAAMAVYQGLHPEARTEEGSEK